METCIEYCEPGLAYISSDERRWINRIKALADARPDECVVIKHPADNGGFIYAKFPQKWVQVKPPSQRTMTDEQREAARLRMTYLRQTQLSKQQQQ